MTVRTAVDKARVAEDEQRAAPSLATVVRQSIEKQASAFAAVLPKDVDRERWARLTLTAVKANPGLMECFATTQGQTSLLLAAMQCAALGLEPNTHLHEAVLRPRKNYGVVECELAIEYRGYMKLGRRSGDVKDIAAEVVYEGDEFEYHLDAEKGRVLVHRPCGEDDPAKITHAYCIVWFLNGGRAMSVLTLRQIHKRRARSDSWKAKPEKSPWTTDFDRMARKSAIRALFSGGEVPLTADVARALGSDDRTFAIDDEAGVIEAESTDHVPELEPAGEAGGTDD